jgi:hypothetical protein
VSAPPISLEAAELLCELLEHERQVEAHLVALSELALDLEAQGQDGYLRELIDHSLVAPAARFYWQGDRAMTRLTTAGVRAARLADDTLNPQHGGPDDGSR